MPDTIENRMDSFTLENRNGIKLTALSYGGIVTEILVPDRDGEISDIVLGLPSAEAYRINPPYFGALIGRLGNRLRNARFRLDGATYRVAANAGENHLHGGLQGFDQVEWEGRAIEGADFQGVDFRYISADGEEGYPGELDTRVRYKLTDANEWVIEYRATTTKPTVLNLTQHSYFNLAGHSSGDVLNHEIRIESDFFTPYDAGQVLTGEVRSLDGSALDFRMAKPIGRDIDADEEAIRLGGGHDHNYVLNRKAPGERALAATVYDPSSGRKMELWTTEPAVQFYTANSLDGTLEGKDGVFYGPRTGLCLETQHFPDAPNHPDFASVRLDPGQVYESTTTYKFSAR
jgi:aldose 1-epimerase